MDPRTRLAAAGTVAAATAAHGPRALGQGYRPGGAPFAYVPPPGFEDLAAATGTVALVIARLTLDRFAGAVDRNVRADAL